MNGPPVDRSKRPGKMAQSDHDWRDEACTAQPIDSRAGTDHTALLQSAETGKLLLTKNKQKWVARGRLRMMSCICKEAALHHTKASGICKLAVVSLL